MLDSLSASAKARAFAVPIALITGSSPIIKDYSNYSTIDFNSDQKKILRGFLSEQLSPSTPRAGKPLKRGETGVKINVNSVLLPEIARHYWYYIAALVALGYALGAGSLQAYHARRA